MGFRRNGESYDVAARRELGALSKRCDSRRIIPCLSDPTGVKPSSPVAVVVCFGLFSRYIVDNESYGFAGA